MYKVLSVALFATALQMKVGVVAAEPVTQVSRTCDPVDVAQIDSRVHIKCATAYGIGQNYIWWYALPTTGDGDESNTASRFMSLGIAALTAGKTLEFWFDELDTSGADYGCGAANCRKPSAFFLIK